MTIHHLPTARPAGRPAECPTWCDGDHPRIISDHPTPDPAVADVVYHRRRIGSAEGLSIAYQQAEPADQHPEPPARLTLRAAGAALSVDLDADQLRSWARELIRAADHAERLDGGRPC